MRFALIHFIAGWSSSVARQAHNLKVLGSNPNPAPILKMPAKFKTSRAFFLEILRNGATDYETDLPPLFLRSTLPL